MSSLVRRRVLVTGGASGIGEATARLFSSQGDEVIIADTQVERAQGVVNSIASNGARFVPLDVSQPEQVDAVAQSLWREQPIDVLVQSAGLLQDAFRLAEMDMEEYDRLMAVNLRGSILLGRAIAPRMAARGSGSIIHLCSLTSLRPSPQIGYAISKVGLKMLTEIMAAEYGPSGVRVNAVAPGYTITPAMQSRIDKGERDPSRMLSQAAMRRFVETKDVAETIYFLCSDAAKAITGVTLPVDCGFLPSSAYQAYAAQPREIAP
jgi:NAD(P)-dependent dehydrogenase (short-subunit alcohol dehydrogenase family)